MARPSMMGARSIFPLETTSVASRVSSFVAINDGYMLAGEGCRAQLRPRRQANFCQGADGLLEK